MVVTRGWERGNGELLDRYKVTKKKQKRKQQQKKKPTQLYTHITLVKQNLKTLENVALLSVAWGRSTAWEKEG